MFQIACLFYFFILFFFTISFDISYASLPMEPNDLHLSSIEGFLLPFILHKPYLSPGKKMEILPVKLHHTHLANIHPELGMAPLHWTHPVDLGSPVAEDKPGQFHRKWHTVQLWKNPQLKLWGGIKWKLLLLFLGRTNAVFSSLKGDFKTSLSPAIHLLKCWQHTPVIDYTVWQSLTPSSR